MRGISTLAAIMSVFSFSFVFITLLYPQLSKFNSRWKGPAFYGSISGATLLVAALTSPPPNVSEQEWSWIDWLVIGLGGGTGLAVVTKRMWWPRTKPADGPAGQKSEKKPVNARGKQSRFAKKRSR